MDKGTKIRMINGLTTKHHHKSLAAMSVNVGRRVTKPMDVFRVDLWHGASIHNRGNSRWNQKKKVTQEVPVARDLP